MNFFDKLLQGIGFANEDEIEQIDSKIKEKKVKKVKHQKIQNTYTLNEQKSKDLSIMNLEPSNQNEVIILVDFLKNGASARVNLSRFSDSDLNRAIDFLQGACYVLNIEPIFEDNRKILFKQ